MLRLEIEVPRRQFDVAVAFSVAPGERFALFGPSGAGKTTVLEAVAGLLEPRRGSILLDERVLWSSGSPGHRFRQQVPIWQRKVALLRQDPALFPHLSVRQNLTYSRPDPAEVARLARLLDIEGLLDVMPSKLSGGQVQRVALARALAGDYRAVLLDEPYTGLEALLRRKVTALLREETASRAVPAVLVSHELEEAQAFADRLGIVDRGQLVQVGTPREVVLRPATQRVAELVGYSGFLARGREVLGVHPARVLLGAHPQAGLVLAGRLADLRPAGAGFEADLLLEGSALTCRLDGEPPAVGATLEVTVVDPPCFDSTGRLLSGHRVALA